MTDAEADLAAVAAIAADLEALGVTPILIGGMALVILGSQRVTADFDFLIARPENLHALVELFYDRGFELVSRVNDAGAVTATIDNRRVAAARLRMDAPSTAYFFRPDTRLRIDLLFDFPVPAAPLAVRAKKVSVGSYRFRLASETDLLRLKKLALAARSFAGDAQDVEFLTKRRRSNRD